MRNATTPARTKGLFRLLWKPLLRGTVILIATFSGGSRHPFSQTHGGPERYLLVLRSIFLTIIAGRRQNWRAKKRFGRCKNTGAWGAWPRMGGHGRTAASTSPCFFIGAGSEVQIKRMKDHIHWDPVGKSDRSPHRPSVIIQHIFL